MSLFAQYFKEQGGKDVLEVENGFIVYKILGKECYIEDIYVVPAERKSGLAYALAEAVVEKAKGLGCTHVTGSVSPPAPTAQESALRLMKWGMQMYKAEKDMVYFVKEIT